jgi:hypothetical protein
VTQFVPAMGVHIEKPSNITLPFWNGSSMEDPPGPVVGPDQLRNPIGLICTDSNPNPNVDEADRLIGAWYSIPNDEVAAFYGVPCSPSCQPTGTQPVGFGTTNTDEDNIWVSGTQMSWHTHPGLCVWDIAQTTANSQQNMTEAQCDAVGAGGYYVWFQEYAWMVHLYNFIPNQDGRFIMWSSYVPNNPN